MSRTDARRRIVVTRSVPGRFEAAGCEIDIGGPELPERVDVLERISGAAIVVTMFSDRVDDEFLDAAGPSLKGICQFAMGYDNIDLEACRKRGVLVTNTPDAVTEGTADLAWTLLLAVARRLLPADRFARSRAYPEGGPLAMDQWLGADLTGRTLLIVGAGRIGYAVALRGLGWGMRTLYVARSRHLNFELAPLAAERVTLEDGLERADVVSIHVPLTKETRGMIDAKAIARMRPGAILINTARGPIVDEGVLAAALRDGRIYGAGLDVFEREPEVHPALLGLENVVLTPHIGSAARRYREVMTEMVAENARAILEGREPPNRVA
jgi:glyoxylate reductase